MISAIGCCYSSVVELYSCSKENISAVLTTGEITDKAKKLFDEYDIAYAENIPDSEFMNCGEKD